MIYNNLLIFTHFLLSLSYYYNIIVANAVQRGYRPVLRSLGPNIRVLGDKSKSELESASKGDGHGSKQSNGISRGMKVKQKSKFKSKIKGGKSGRKNKPIAPNGGKQEGSKGTKGGGEIHCNKQGKGKLFGSNAPTEFVKNSNKKGKHRGKDAKGDTTKNSKGIAIQGKEGNAIKKPGEGKKEKCMQSSMPTTTSSLPPSYSSSSPSAKPFSLANREPSITPTIGTTRISSLTPSGPATPIPRIPSTGPTVTTGPLQPVCADDEIRFVLNIINDDYISDTSWTLRNNCTGEIVLEGNYDGATACIDNGRYIFTIHDDFGDGICCNNGSGYYEIYINEELKKEGGEFSFEESTSIEIGSSYGQSNFDCTQLDHSAVPMIEIPFSELLLQFSFPTSQRRLSHHRQGDQEELYAIVYKFLFESFNNDFSPFEGLIMSIGVIDEANFSVEGRVLFESNVSFIPASKIVDDYLLDILKGDSFLMELQRSGDKTFATTTGVNVSRNKSVGSNIIPPEPQNDCFKSTVVITISCCIFCCLAIFLNLLRLRLRGLVIITRPNELHDDCSTASPGSDVKYKNDVQYQSQIYSLQCESVHSLEDKVHSFSSISSSESESSGNISNDEQGKHNGVSMLEISGFYCDNEEERSHNHRSLFTIENDYSCAESINTDSTPRSDNKSNRQLGEI